MNQLSTHRNLHECLAGGQGLQLKRMAFWQLTRERGETMRVHEATEALEDMGATRSEIEQKFIDLERAMHEALSGEPEVLKEKQERLARVFDRLYFEALTIEQGLFEYLSDFESEFDY
jgi:hypothetical protein